MLEGHIDSSSHQALIGWAADSDKPGVPLLLRVMVNGVEHGRIIANQLRVGLRDRGYGDGHHGFVYAFDLPLSPLQGYDVVVRLDERPIDIPKGRFRLEALGPNDLALRPLLVSATGRSGTTLLMRRLGNAHEIVIADQYPFETKLLTYYGYALGVLTTPSSIKNQTRLDELTLNPYQLGLNPFHHPQMESLYPKPALLYEFFGRRTAARLRTVLRDIIDEFYRDMKINTRKGQARFFAEKCDVFLSTRNFARLAFDGVKELLLVRDPRDVHCSRRHFWSDTPEISVQNLKSVQSAILRIRHEERADLLVVRYEDLVRQPTVTLERISKYLGLSQSIVLDAKDEGPMFSLHGTSQDPHSSIGRWKQELSIEERESLTQIFRPFLDEFGYE